MSKNLKQTTHSYKLERQPSFTQKEQFMTGITVIPPYIQANHNQSRFHDKDLSLRSVSSHKRSHISRHSQKTANDNYHSPLGQSGRSQYQAIERILKSQNDNLKRQNQLLLNQIQRLKTSNRNYKDTCRSQRIQMSALNEECAIQKKRADEMKQLIMSRLVSLESKALGNSQGFAEDKMDLIDILHGSSDLSGSMPSEPQ